MFNSAIFAILCRRSRPILITRITARTNSPVRLAESGPPRSPPPPGMCRPPSYTLSRRRR